MFGGQGGGMRFSFGGGSPFGGPGQQQAQMKGSDLVYELPLTLKEVATGSKKPISFQHKGQTEKITVTIPPGMITGKKLRLAGKGEASPYGGPPGDLYIQSKVTQDPEFTPDGYDLQIERTIRLTESMLGTEINVPSIDGKALSLKIPPGTRHGTKMRLPGKGLPAMKGNQRGDLYVKINISLPRELTPTQKELVEKLAESGL
jgi:curved DNA-binding protein